MLTKSIYRHLLHFTLVLILFGVGFWYGSNGKAELKGEIIGIRSELEELRDNAKKPKISVQNNVKDVKVKDGAQLSFIPETQVHQINVDGPEQEIKAIVPIKNQIKILKLQEHLNHLKENGKRKKKQQKLQEEINRLRKPP